MLKYQKFDAAAQRRFYSSRVEKIAERVHFRAMLAHLAVRDQRLWRDVIETSVP
jgi:hypothetical protein